MFKCDPGWKNSPVLCKPAYHKKALKDDNKVIHLLNNWGHYENRSRASLSTLAFGPSWELRHSSESIPGSPARSILSLWPRSPTTVRVTGRDVLEDISWMETHQALCFRHKISHLTCSHAPSKGRLHPHHLWLGTKLPLPQDHTLLGIWCVKARQWGKQRNSSWAAFCCGLPLP